MDIRLLTILFVLGGCSSNSGNNSVCVEVCVHVTALGCPISNCVDDCVKQLSAAEIACLKTTPTCQDALSCGVPQPDLRTAPLDLATPSNCVTVEVGAPTGSAAPGTSCVAGSDCTTGYCARFGIQGYCTISCAGGDCSAALATTCRASAGGSYCILSGQVACR